MAYREDRMGAAYLLAKLVAALSASPQTLEQLAEYSGLHYRTVSRYIKAFRDLGIVYIAEYMEDRRGRVGAPAYMLTTSTKKDAKKPTLSRSQVQRRYREKKRGQVPSVFAWAQTHTRVSNAIPSAN